MKKLFGVVVLFILLSCDENTLSPNPLLVSRIDQEINVVNNSNRNLYIAVFPERITHVIDWLPIISEENKLAPGAIRKLPLEDASTSFGELPSDENLVFYYWEAVIRDGKLAPGIVNSLVFSP